MADKKFNALENLKNKLAQKNETVATNAKPAAKPSAKPAASPVAAKPAPAAKVESKPAASLGRPVTTARPVSAPAPAPAAPKKTVEELAKEVIRGDWGNGQERKDKLAAAGYNYDEVQDKVNAILYGTPAATTAAPLSSTKKSIEEIAKEVIRGNWGNGQERKDKLAAAGYNYDEVQAMVNKLLK